MILSIIIPVFNTEKYIRKCLDSCLHQDEKEYEIIVIDDGSPDNSVDIVKQIAATTEKVRIVSQPNLGLSAARNVGLSLAQGEFVWFVDSDDYIEDNCLGRIFSNLRNNIDILQLQYRMVYENGEADIDVPFYIIDGVKKGKDILLAGGLPAPAQFSIYRTEFLRKNELKFYEGILHEDSEFKPRVTFLAESIISDTEVSYNYLQRITGSITSSFKLKNATSILIVMNSIKKFIYEYNVDKQISRCFYRMIGHNMNSLLIGYRQLNDFDKNYINNELKKNRHLFVCMMKSANIKYILEGFLFYINSKIGLYFHNFFR